MSPQQKKDFNSLLAIFKAVVDTYSGLMGLRIGFYEEYFLEMYLNISANLDRDYGQNIQKKSWVKWAGYFASYLHKDRIVYLTGVFDSDSSRHAMTKHRVNAAIAIEFAIQICDVNYKHRVLSPKINRHVIDLRRVARNHLKQYFFTTYFSGISGGNPGIINPNPTKIRNSIANDEMAMTLILEMFMEGRYDPPNGIQVQATHNL